MQSSLSLPITSIPFTNVEVRSNLSLILFLPLLLLSILVSLFIRYSSHIPEIQLAFIITSLISNFTLITVRCSFFLQYTLSFRIAYCSSHPHQDTIVWTQPQSARTRFPSNWIPVHSMPILFSLCHITQRFFNQAECQHLKFQLSAPFSYLFFPSCCLLKHLPPPPCQPSLLVATRVSTDSMIYGNGYENTLYDLHICSSTGCTSYTVSDTTHPIHLNLGQVLRVRWLLQG